MDYQQQFLWKRATGRGYQWQTLKVGGKLTRVLTFPTPFGSASFEPIEPLIICSSLLRLLAETEPKESGILNFANAYGLLTEQIKAAPPSGGRAYVGDSLSIWKAAIADARQALNLWQAIQDTDEKALTKLIKWRAGPCIHFNPTDRNSVIIAHADDDPVTISLFEPGDVVLPARVMLQRLVNEQLQPRLVDSNFQTGKEKKALQMRVTPQLLWNPDEAKQEIRLVLENLIGAIWLQFAQEIDGRKAIVRCPTCSTWFERTRTDKGYCSDRCRVQAHRERKRKGS